MSGQSIGLTAVATSITANDYHDYTLSDGGDACLKP